MSPTRESRYIVSNTITLNLSDALSARIERQARGTRQSVDALLVHAIQT